MELQLDVVENMNNTFRENPELKNLIKEYSSLISWLYKFKKMIDAAQNSGINTDQSDGLPFIKKIFQCLYSEARETIFLRNRLPPDERITSLDMNIYDPEANAYNIDILNHNLTQIIIFLTYLVQLDDRSQGLAGWRHAISNGLSQEHPLLSSPVIQHHLANAQNLQNALAERDQLIIQNFPASNPAVQEL